MACRRIWTVAILLMAGLGLSGAARADALLSNPAPTVDADINLGAGPYPDQSLVAAGSPQPWYDSPQVARLFGGTPTAAQQQSFDQAVLQRVQQTFQLSGINVTLTDSSNVSAAHTLSVVSDSSSSPFPGSIGTSVLGQNGFSFIDVEAQSAQSVDQLEWIVAHNVAHELMLTFGVGENYDKTGNYIDATTLNWATVTSANATFSPAAAAAINASLSSIDTSPILQSSAQAIAPSITPSITPEPTPEPMAMLLWGVAATAALVRRGRSRRARG